MISMPPLGALLTPSVPWSWHRPEPSLASSSSCASRASANGLNAFSGAFPFGVASTSCWSPNVSIGDETHEAVGAALTIFGFTSSPSVSWTIVCPPRFGPVASVPTDAKVLPLRVKKSRSECGLPVGMLPTSCHAPLGVAWNAGFGTDGLGTSGAGWSSSLFAWPAKAGVAQRESAVTAARNGRRSGRMTARMLRRASRSRAGLAGRRRTLG
jgi:hypothetical protein